MCILNINPKNKMKVSSFFLLLVSLLLFQCGVQVADTSGSETGNANIKGKILNTNGSNATNTEIRLFTSTYNPVEDTNIVNMACDTTDCNGCYQFNVSNNTEYNLQAIHLDSGTCLIIPRVNVSNDTIVLTDTLKLPGKVQVILSDTLDTTNA